MLTHTGLRTENTLGNPDLVLDTRPPLEYNANMKQINNNWAIASLAVDVIVACVGFLCVLGCLVKIALYLAEIN